MAYFMRTGCNTFAQMCQGANGLVWLGDDGQNKAVAIDEIANARIFSADMRRNIVETSVRCRLSDHSTRTLAFGWLSPEGVFFPLQEGHHRDFVTSVLKAEDRSVMYGWISVHDSFWQLVEQSGHKTGIITDAQRATLSRIGRNPDNTHAEPAYQMLDFDSVMPDWTAQIARMDAGKPCLESSITGAHELNEAEKADLVLKLCLTQPRVHSMAIVGMGATTPPSALRARFP